LIPGDTQPRKYVCIPEKYVYGWIFSIKSDSEELWKSVRITTSEEQSLFDDEKNSEV
jgi:hypothetical protein